MRHSLSAITAELQRLKAEGSRTVAISPESVALLRQALAKSRPAVAPAPAASTTPAAPPAGIAAAPAPAPVPAPSRTAEEESEDEGVVVRSFLFDGAAALAQPLVRITDDRVHEDGGVPRQKIFDFDHRNVFATTDQHVLGASADADVALGVAIGKIARIKPATLLKGLQVGPLEVAEKHLRAARQKPTGLAHGLLRARVIGDPHVHALERAAVGTGRLFVRTRRLGQGARQDFGHAPE